MLILRIFCGALIGLAVAVVELLILMVASEWAIAEGWLDIYDDATIALIAFCTLIAAPIIGGWKAWTDGRGA